MHFRICYMRSGRFVLEISFTGERETEEFGVWKMGGGDYFVKSMQNW
jgi:hypothetical protein